MNPLQITIKQVALFTMWCAGVLALSIPFPLSTLLTMPLFVGFGTACLSGAQRQYWGVGAWAAQFMSLAAVLVVFYVLIALGIVYPVSETTEEPAYMITLIVCFNASILTASIAGGLLGPRVASLVNGKKRLNVTHAALIEKDSRYRA
ncbi:MAG: hypothetical protein AAGG48_25390 [Planctomycetota bacterium]